LSGNSANSRFRTVDLPAPLGPEITIGRCETRAAVSMGFGLEGMGGGAILVVRGRERWRREVCWER
jgi:hypothetical protein